MRPGSKRSLAALAAVASLILAACGDTGGGSANAGGGGTTTTTAGSGGESSGGTGGATASTTSSSSSTDTGCHTNADCVNDPAGPICDGSTGACVGCIPSNDPALDCGVGAWCVPNVQQCQAGCSGDQDCPPNGQPLVCDLASHACVGCTSDNNCPAGSICIGGSCLPGCTDTHPCNVGQSCCGQQCFDLISDENNCGACNKVCELVPHAQVLCQNGNCQQGLCSPGYADCNGNQQDGCETNTVADGPCTCAPGETEPCYLGAPGSAGVGPCKAGTRTCNADGLGWGACLGQVLPQPEICANNIDENCDGIKDNAADFDLDGWSTCEGDCNDGNALVNPGAFEVTYTLVDNDNNPQTPPIVVPGGNGVDDDCDPNTPDNVEPGACGTLAPKLQGVTATDVANAMDLCQSTTVNAPKPTKKWGLLDAQFKLGSGADPGAQLTNFQNYQAAIMTQYGYLNGNPATPNNPPKKGPTMAGLSSGRMRYVGQTDYTVPQSGTSFGGASACPAAYLAAHGGTLPSSQGCSGNCLGGNTCNDSILVRLQIRVPTNAQSMSYDFRFFSAEYPDFLCSTFNDFYLALLTTGAPGIPMDKNVSFDALGNAVSVNNGFFEVCQPASCFACNGGVTGLAGTGMDGNIGGGTTWLTTDAPVVPGETMTLELVVFDVGDTIYDSLALVDNFRWGLASTTVATHQ